MNQKISVLITAYKEVATIQKAIRSIAISSYSGITEPYEILLAAPDDETHSAALSEVMTLEIPDKFVYVKDPGKKAGKGKPTALNMLLQQATGEYLIFTDGDVYFDKNAVKELLKPFENKDIVLITGRPKSGDKKNSVMGYFGHLLSDAAHHKRTVELTENTSGRSQSVISKNHFFPVSGYIYAVRKSYLEQIHNKDVRIFPEDCLVDDAYISYLVHNAGGKIAYAPNAVAYIKYPTNLSDYFKQKKRSTGGYVQLWQYGVVKPETKTRSFRKELEYFWFPFTYASNSKEFFWSLLLYPIRLWLWIMIFWERRVVKKDFVKTWVRIESTK